ncbi:hypothetical protein L1887_02508 [Cichorium endivia]|nr:hypothetical protein L1887_02508 [Cichorium endivia]
MAEMLKTNPDKGINDDESNILDMKNVFGSNTYPRKKGRSFWRFLLDACRDTTLIILMVVAAASLALGIKTEWEYWTVLDRGFALQLDINNSHFIFCRILILYCHVFYYNYYYISGLISHQKLFKENILYCSSGTSP